MKTWFQSFVFLVLLTSVAHARCEHRNTVYGKIIAVCGDLNLVMAGTTELNDDGVTTFRNEYEMTDCDGARRMRLTALNEDGIFPLQFSERNVLGWDYEKRGPLLTEERFIVRAQGKLYFTHERSDGVRSETSCEEYEDSRSDIQYFKH